MTRKVRPRTVALRDQLLAILRNETAPITTNEVLVKLANGGCNCNSPRAVDRTCKDWSGRWAMRDGCPALCWYTQVYPQLCALMRLGLVERIRHADHRSAFWRYVETDTDAHFNAAVDAMRAT